MNTLTRIPHIACALITILLILVFGCSGGDGPIAPNLVVGSITGPESFSESTFPTFTIEAHGDTGLTSEWLITPDDAGWFTAVNPTTVTFRPAEVSSDRAAEIRVTVTPTFGDKVVRTLDVVIVSDIDTAGAQLNVSDIIGATIIPGANWVTYGIETSGDTGVKCHWTIDPPASGTLTHPDSRYTNFATANVTEDTPALLKVTVESDNSGVITRTLAITIVPGQPTEPGLSVNNIAGPAVVEEEKTISFSVRASGDTGIGYHWAVDPPDAGFFTEPNAPASDFTATQPDKLIVYPFEVTISVTVSSDNFDSVIKTRKLKIINLDPLVSWIESPNTVTENTCETYIINTDPYFDPLMDEPMPLRWEVDPIYAGVFMKSVGLPPDENYFISQCYTPAVLFKAAEVPYDFPAVISCYYFEPQQDGSVLKTLIDSVDITILNDSAKPPGDHWTTPSAIVGPTEMVETITDVFFYGLPDLDPSYDYKWSVKVIDDWANGMPYFGNNPNPYPGTIEPTRDENGTWTWHLVEFIPANFDMTTWILIEVETVYGVENFIVCVLPIPQPCIFTTEIWKPFWHSSYLVEGLTDPLKPEEPWFDQPIFEPYDEWELHSGDVVRMFAITDSYFPTDILRIKWETEPPGAVHFLGDYPFIYDEEIEEEWLDISGHYLDPYFPNNYGSHYLMEGGSMTTVVWTEMKVLTSEEFDLVLTVESFDCDTAIRVKRFNH